MLNSTNVSAIHRIFVTLPKFIEKLQSQGLSNHYVLIISRLKGFPVLYEDAVAKPSVQLFTFALTPSPLSLCFVDLVKMLKIGDGPLL